MKLRQKIDKALIGGAICTLYFIISITLSAEINLALKENLKLILFHHWFAKSVLALVVFILSSVVFFLFPALTKNEKEPYLLDLLSVSAFLGTCFITAFFIWHSMLQ